MTTALAILMMVAAVAAEAPYHLPRPAGHAPAFHLPVPAPAPPHFAPQPQPQHNSGYQYQQPSFGQNFAPHAPQQHLPAHHHQHQQHHQPAPAYFPPAPAPQPFPVNNYPQFQPASFPQPSQSYGLPHSAPRLPAPQPIHHHQQSFAAPQPAPLPQFHQSTSFPQPQFSPQQGYNYQQPQALPHFSQQIPLQAQPLTNHIGGASSLSSYQADSHQYSGVHRDALDSVVVGRVQNIIKENEHSSARNAGYLSLVSGVSLENAKPSVEISSFVQTSPLVAGLNSGLSSHGSSFGSSLSGHSAPSGNYGLPSFSVNSQSTSSGSFNSGSFNFLPQNKPAQSYGPPH